MTLYVTTFFVNLHLRRFFFFFALSLYIQLLVASAKICLYRGLQSRCFCVNIILEKHKYSCICFNVSVSTHFPPQRNFLFTSVCLCTLIYFVTFAFRFDTLARFELQLQAATVSERNFCVIEGKPGEKRTACVKIYTHPPNRWKLSTFLSSLLQKFLCFY